MSRRRLQTRVCIDCGLWYQRMQDQGDPRRCLQCAVEYAEDVLCDTSRGTGSDTLARKYTGRVIDTRYPSV